MGDAAGTVNDGGEAGRRDDAALRGVRAPTAPIRLVDCASGGNG